jgi:ribonuclease BN (tRNA processing enzyme)
MKIIPLGTNGYFSSYGRQTMSFLLLAQDRAILLDAGSGVGRLVRPDLAAELSDFATVDILLSHYHLDHIIGLSYLPAVCAHADLRLHAPGPPLVDVTASGALNGFLRPPYFSRELGSFPVPVEVLEYTQESLDIGSLNVRFRRQNHPGGSVGMRFGDDVAYITDTVVDTATADFVRGVDVLLHEVWLADEAESAAHGHAGARGVASIAESAGVRCLAPIHHHPQHRDEDLQVLVDELSACCSVEILLLREGEALDLNGK